jgi:hypothetical protein
VFGSMILILRQGKARCQRSQGTFEDVRHVISASESTLAIAFEDGNDRSIYFNSLSSAAFKRLRIQSARLIPAAWAAASYALRSEGSTLK